MNIYDLKQATTGMTLERPIWLKQSEGPVPLTVITEGEDTLYLSTSEAEQLTLSTLWEQETDKELVAVLEEEIKIFGYRVVGDEIILG